MRNTERLYTTLLFRASRKYPAWDPEIPMEVGDYGTITAGRESRSWGFRSVFTRRRYRSKGVFLKEGNVYAEGIAQKHALPAPKEYGGDSSSVTWVTSQNAQEIDVEAAAGGKTPVMVDCNVKAAFQFSSKRGAVLVMHNDAISTIQPPAKIRFLFDEPKLHGKVIVSEVHRCSSYARYVATDKTSTVALGLSVSSPGPAKTRTRKDKQRLYYPLFRLVSLDETGLATGLRGGSGGGDSPLPDALPSWMEEDGDEDDDLPAASDSSDTESEDEGRRAA